MPNNLNQLIDKYNVSTPRYTSYPTVPCWNEAGFSTQGWIGQLKKNFYRDPTQGISIYIHLPFCESLCTYCGCNTRITKNHQVEEPYINALIQEWRLYRSILGNQALHIKEIHLGGGTPTFFAPENLRQLIAAVLEGNTLDENPSFSFEAHPANTSAAHLSMLYEVGFRRLSLGIQDFNPDVQRVINRKQTIEDVRGVMDQARSIGYTSINFDLIYGLPLQTLHSVFDTLMVALSMKPERISFYSYAHVPWIKPGQRYFTEQDLPVGKEKMDLYKLGKAMIVKAGYKEVGMDHYALPGDSLLLAAENGKLHRNFMGYTDNYTPLLIGLGVSSISDAWSAYAQNVKTVEEYYRLLNKEELPIMRGHLLSTDDEQSRRYILEMMCREKAILDKNDVYKNDKIHKRLLPLRADGLVRIKGDVVTATPKGKAFIRNVCTAFDEYLHHEETEASSVRFSQAV
ncbi:oxygen-independent coproporphyrinogen III oxidase [Sphingobacterium sp. lm-10]|uniref:oxygen-independent coproporphyrinogen III oxidase n=1 Tax=Sphingobacterium sp. lm-10 TaxID=2944904 RepID=UPI0020207FA8|nr:oxygen-independent coproporphyrinogen III oxidase [Sphingobacterium sp. lm-10]MCL7989342.1 oxygen-independent coproporphyrinogen III oxidase [Sphingobacterium sp. lm-10]